MSGENGNLHDQLLDLKRKFVSSTVRCERLNHHLSFLKNCVDKDIIPKGLLLEKTINPMKSSRSWEI